MSGGAHTFSSSPRDQEVLGALLHSLSQPLTSLRCSLELSIDEKAEQQRQMVSAALEQTEAVIGMIQLMREYLDSECSEATMGEVELMPVVLTVSEDISSIAALRGVTLHVTGNCGARLKISEARLRRALQYLVVAFVEEQGPDTIVKVALSDGPVACELRGEGTLDARFRKAPDPAESSKSRKRNHSTLPEILREVKLAIVARVLRNADVELVVDQLAPRFALRLPVRTVRVGRETLPKQS